MSRQLRSGEVVPRLSLPDAEVIGPLQIEAERLGSN